MPRRWSRNLMAAYAESLAELDWMGDDTRREALAKLRAIRPKIGYPEKWRSYEGLAVRRDDLVGNVMRGRRFDHALWIAKLGQPVDRDEWRSTPQIVNAFYNATRNEIIFPAGILQPPFFDAGADDAANYGGIGTVIGHEISHAFDDEGSRYDGAGVLRNWWTSADRERFEARTKRMVQQYDAYSPIEGYHVNGALTLGENVADNAGLAMAVRAYRHALAGKTAPTLDGYTGEQRLFIAFAQIWKMKVREAAQIERLKTDPHSPGQFRADGAAVNQVLSPTPSNSSPATRCTARRRTGYRSGSGLGGEPLQRLLVELEAQPGLVRQHELALLDHRRLLVERHHPRHVLDGEAVGAGRHHVHQHLGHDVADDRQVEGLGHAGDLHPLRGAADPREIDHDDVDRVRLDHLPERRDAPDILAARDRRLERRGDARQALVVVGGRHVLEPEQADARLLDAMADVDRLLGPPALVDVAHQLDVGPDHVADHLDAAHLVGRRRIAEQAHLGLHLDEALLEQRLGRLLRLLVGEAAAQRARGIGRARGRDGRPAASTAAGRAPCP